MSGDLQDLLKLLEENAHVNPGAIERFISDLKIIPSKKPTKTIIIYWVYLHWCIDKNLLPIPRNSFFKQFKRHFNPASRDRYRRYYVTSKHFNLHPREILEAETEAWKERQWHGTRRNKMVKGMKANPKSMLGLRRAKEMKNSRD